MLPISNVISGSIAGRKNPNVVFANDEKEASSVDTSEMWFELLQSEKHEIRKRAIQELEKAGKNALPCLESGMKNPDPYIRRDSIYLIGKLKLEEKIPDLVEALSNAVLRHVAQGALLALGNKSVPELAKTLETLDPEKDNFYIQDIINTLKKIGKDANESVGQLYTFLHRTTDIGLAKGALNTLSKIGSKEAIDVLVRRAMNDYLSNDIRNYAIACLADIARKNVENATMLK